nr:hypothetical protein [Polyangiaceae bacterium]
VRDGSTQFQDATGEENAKKADDLHRKESTVRGAIADLERDKKVGAHTIEAKKKELQEIERSLKALTSSSAPRSGSYLRYGTEQVREGAGKDSAIEEALRAYYKRVNEFNKVNFAERRPSKPGKGEASYVGVEACTPCHQEERKVWDKTAHAKAYATLSTQYKEFNLDCVSCHVTGYDKPGGSTVTHVEKLKDVQCETCHGPGSLHTANPKVAIPVAVPKPEMCVGCHHPPHVHSFDGAEKMNAILGSGHGL